MICFSLMLSFQDFFHRGTVKLIHGHKFAVVEHSPVIEHTGQSFGLLQRIHMNKRCRNVLCCTVFLQFLDPLRNIRTLIIVVNGQFPPVDGLVFALGANRGAVPSKLSASSS